MATGLRPPPERPGAVDPHRSGRARGALARAHTPRSAVPSSARARLVHFSGSTDPATLDEAIAAGAEGVLSKARGIDEVLAMIERAHLGDVLLDPELLREMAFRSPSTSPPTPRAESLTRRERAVLEALLASGRTTVAAEQLGIATATVRVHVHRACAKLGARTRLESVSRALRAGVIDPPAS